MGVQMQMETRRSELREAEASPLAFAIAENDRSILTTVAEAVRLRRLRLAYQPVVVANDPARTGFHEGLIRILDQTGRIIPARDFMSVVETQELGREIDCAALAMGLDALRRHPDLKLSVNMSARSIGWPRWMRILRSGLSAAQGIGERLILEITETSAMTVPDLVAGFMADLQAQGISFAIDGFGAGHSALRYFKEFSFDLIKVDAQFTRNIHADADNQVLMAAFLAIARQFDMLCVAQGVEQAAEAEWLCALGVDCMQGYHFAAPSILPEWDRG